MKTGGKIELFPLEIYLFTSFVFSVSKQPAKSSQHKTDQQLDLEKAKFLMNQAIDDDSAGNIEEAIAQYSEAVELCLKIVSEPPTHAWA